jgi:quercetin dioxygenase-like cupin family protein
MTAVPGETTLGCASAGEEAEAHPPSPVVPVRVDEDEALPRAEERGPVRDGNGDRRGDETGEDVVATVSRRTVPVSVGGVDGKEPIDGIGEIVLRSRSRLHQCEAGGRVRYEDTRQPVPAAVTKARQPVCQVGDERTVSADLVFGAFHRGSSSFDRTRRRRALGNYDAVVADDHAELGGHATEASEPVLLDQLATSELRESQPEIYDRPIGVRLLYRNPDTGAEHYLIRYRAGLQVKWHRHSAAHTFIVLEGALEANGRRFGAGSYCHFPAGTVMHHAPSRDEDCLFVAIFDGPQDVQLAHHPPGAD